MVKQPTNLEYIVHMVIIVLVELVSQINTLAQQANSLMISILQPHLNVLHVLLNLHAIKPQTH